MIYTRKFFVIFMIFILEWSISLIALAKDDGKYNYSVSLQNYIQDFDTLKVFETFDEKSRTVFGVGNILEAQDKDKISYYQSVWIMDDKGDKMRYPLVLKRFVIYKNNGKGVVLNKNLQMPFRQNLSYVENFSFEPIIQSNIDTPIIQRLKETKEIKTPAGTFDSIIIKTYNPSTNEGIYQYLAKDVGLVKMVGFNEDNENTICQLIKIKNLSPTEKISLKKSFGFH